MNLIPFKIVILSAMLLAVISSCTKDEEMPQQYLRGGNGMAVAADGNLIIAGYNTSSSKGYEATLILAQQSNGDTLWSRKFGGTYSDAFYSVKKSHEGGFIAVGFTNRASAGSPSMFVVITDANGTMLETKSYGGSAYSQAFSVLPIANADSGYLIAGYIQKSSSADRDIYLVRIDNAGDTLWTNSIGSKGADTYDTVNDAAYNVIAAPDGGYFLTGNLKGNSSYGGKIFLMKVTATGDSLWTKTYGNGIGYSLAITSDVAVAISGSLQEGSSQDIFLLKTDTAGKTIWDKGKTFGGAGYEYGANMVETADGGFAIIGITDSKGYGYQDVYLVMTNSMGENAIEKTYGGNNVDQGFGLVLMPDGGFGMTGLSNTDGSYIFLNRVKSDGTQQWGNIRYLQ